MMFSIRERPAQRRLMVREKQSTLMHACTRGGREMRVNSSRPGNRLVVEKVRFLGGEACLLLARRRGAKRMKRRRRDEWRRERLSGCHDSAICGPQWVTSKLSYCVGWCDCAAVLVMIRSEPIRQVVRSKEPL